MLRRVDVGRRLGARRRVDVGRAVGVILDLVVVLVFVALGRSVHAHGVSIGGMASTAWPFVCGLAVGWVAVLLRHRSPGTLGTGAIVSLVTVAVGMALRVVAGQGTVVAFVAVALCFLSAAMCGWRLLWRLLRQLARRART